MRFPGHPPVIVCAFALGVCDARSAGVAALKEQTFHRDSSARVVAYSRIIESGGPYLRIVAGNRNLDILRSKLVARVDVPDGIPASILGEMDIVPLREALTAMREFTARYPAGAALLESRSEAVAAHIRRFDAGDVRFEGTWVSKREFAGIQETRNAEAKAIELAEIEKRVFEAQQREDGLVLHDGKWLTKREAGQQPPESPTELSACVEPLWNGDLEGARFAVKFLTTLASHQTGAPKVRTERLLIAVRNLFRAEARLNHQMIVRAGELREIALHEKHAREYLIPNAFGTIRREAAKESRGKALQIRKSSREALASRRQELLDQLREIEIVTDDFHKLKEHRVVWILGTAARIVGARHFTEDEYRPSFPEESLASIRQQIVMGDESDR